MINGYYSYNLSYTWRLDGKESACNAGGLS